MAPHLKRDLEFEDIALHVENNPKPNVMYPFTHHAIRRKNKFQNMK
jgi:hypothetical protein